MWYNLTQSGTSMFNNNITIGKTCATREHLCRKLRILKRRFQNLSRFHEEDVALGWSKSYKPPPRDSSNCDGQLPKDCS
jgi:hypothetical protein